MNESTGDIFGALTEFYANNPNDPGDFLVGEEANLIGNGPIRNMYNPSALGDPNCWSTSIKNTEVHAAAGPLNHWFYLLSQGSNASPTSPDLQRLDRHRAGHPDRGQDLLQRPAAQDLELDARRRPQGDAPGRGQPVRHHELHQLQHRQGRVERDLGPGAVG